MITSACAMALMALQASSFRAGFTFDCGFASMSDEKAYADLLAEGGLPLKLDAVAWTGGVEALGDVSSSVRLRGAVTVSRFSGSYEENYNPGGYILFGIITGGLGFLFGSPRDEVVTLENRSVNVEMSAYYKLTGNPSVSVGAGPMLAMVSRRIDTPNTSTSETGSGIGFLSGMRIDQESGKVLGLPLVFGAEGGYRVCDVKLDGDRTGDFSVDFSGPYFRVGTYLKF